jgi:hypothetical protein
MTSPQKAKWNTHIEAARFSLKRLEDERIAFAERQKRTKEQIVWELAQKLEEDGMPREWILAQEVKRLRTLLEEKDKEHKATKELVATLQEAQNIDNMPELVDNKIGPVEIKNLSKINQFDRRGYQILASRFAELIKRKLQAESKAAIKFYVLGKDRTTNIEYMVPVSFIVDFTNKTTDLILDETRP